MFVGANYIVTPTERNTPEAIQTCMELGRLLGFANVTTLSPEEHDDNRKCNSGIFFIALD